MSFWPVQTSSSSMGALPLHPGVSTNLSTGLTSQLSSSLVGATSNPTSSSMQQTQMAQAQAHAQQQQMLAAYQQQQLGDSSVSSYYASIPSSFSPNSTTPTLSASSIAAALPTVFYLLKYKNRFLTHSGTWGSLGNARRFLSESEAQKSGIDKFEGILASWEELNSRGVSLEKIDVQDVLAQYNRAKEILGLP